MVYDMNLIEPMQEVDSIPHVWHNHAFGSESGTSTHHLYACLVALFFPLQLFQIHCTGPNQLQQLRHDVSVTPKDLLTVPAVGHIPPFYKHFLGIRNAYTLVHSAEIMNNLDKLHPFPC